MASFRPPQPYPPELHDKITRLLAPPSLPSMQQPFNRASRLSSAGSRRSEQHSGFDDGFNYQQLERDIRSIGAYSTASVLPPYKSDAGQKIWKAWERYKLRTTFKILKSELLKCQKALTFHLLKKLSPRELEILKDPILQARIRFRFGGSQFPPLIYYKVYTLGTNVHYFSGNRVIKAGSQVPLF
ncbi:hypothetical protein BKA69DRAFT_1063090 [Paraphysoderma sedebokerense]|nr:hypothetical protein BKA69DRAFT_1063090 [Paraphysoderma sedebokerense]